MEEDWVDPSKNLPYPYDLLLLKTTRGNLHGWWTGTGWGGLRIKSSDKIIGWIPSYIEHE